MFNLPKIVHTHSEEEKRKGEIAIKWLSHVSSFAYRSRDSTGFWFP